MQLPKGVDVRLLWRDKFWEEDLPIAITEASQFVGELCVGKGTIDVRIDSSLANRFFGIDQKKDKVFLKHDLVKNPLGGLVVPGGGKWYQTKVPVVESIGMNPTRMTKHPQNYMI